MLTPLLPPPRAFWQARARLVERPRYSTLSGVREEDFQSHLRHDEGQDGQIHRRGEDIRPAQL